MNEEQENDAKLRAFLSGSRFASAGAVITDLDGTAVHEFEGRIVIPDPVSHGLKHLNDLGRTVILNTLRFPLNVIRTFGREWYSITNAPLPLISLNGSIAGYLHETAGGDIAFEEIEAVILEAQEIEEVLTGVKGLLDGGLDDLIVFYYSRDWGAGETIWTPSAEKVEGLRDKYRSASAVVATGFDGLRAALFGQEVCMIFLLIDAPEDRLMAYQHAKRSSFITHKGIDKLAGAKSLTRKLGLELDQSIGAGDTPMDSFLKGVGLAVHVGPMDLEYKGLADTIRVGNSLELGALLFRIAELQRGLPR